MRNFALLAIANMLLLCSFAQDHINTDSVHTAYKEKMASIFENVDLTEIPSGILYDRGISYIDMSGFNGNLTDKSKSSLMAFSLAYASIHSMTIDESVKLPEPSVYRNKMDKITPDSEEILVAGLHQEYYQIDSNALANGLLSITDEQLYDEFPRAVSPYNKKEIFLFAPAEYKVRSSNLTLVFDNELFFTNVSKEINLFEVDMGDEAGYRTVTFDLPISAQYVEKGHKTIKVRITYSDDSVYESHFDIAMTKSNNRTEEDIPDHTHYINPINTADPSAGRGGGWLNVYYACGHTRIEKPFIWAEAYNPDVGGIETNLTRKDIQDRISHTETEIEDKVLWNYLQDNGYDIIILDYDHGGDYLPRTAEFIKEAIRWVNVQKHSAGSNAKNVILGQSMGGVCTSLALKEMEVLSGEDHEVESFIIFDSPINGVNIPLATQASVLDMAFLPVYKPYDPTEGGPANLLTYVEAIEDVLKILYLPATRTMVSRFCTDDFTIAGMPASEAIALRPDIETEHLYHDFYNYLHNELEGLPSNCNVLTIANGSEKGYEGQHNFGAGDLIVHSELNNFVIVSLLGGIGADVEDNDLEVLHTNILYQRGSLILWAAGFNTELDIKMYAMENNWDFTYYSSSIDVSLLWGLETVVAHDRNVSKEDGDEIDHIPGGFFGSGNQGIILTEEALGTLMPSTFKMQTWCFTPTGSVLNYHGEDGQTWIDEPYRNYTITSPLIADNKVKGVDNFVGNSETRSWGTAQTFQNTAHTWFTGENAAFVLYHLIGKDELIGVDNLDAGTTYNFGKAVLPFDAEFDTSLPVRTSSILGHSIVVDNTILGVNRYDFVGLTPSPYTPEGLGIARHNSHFTMNIGELCDSEPVEIIIQNGGLFELGDGNTRSGSAHIQNNGTVRIKSGSTLRINKGSTVKLMEGSKLIVESGGTIIIQDEGRLITELGSTIFYHQGAEIQLNGNDSELNLGGDLYLFENASFKPTHEGGASGRIVINNPNGTLISENGASFELEGDNENDLLLTIGENGVLRSHGNMEKMRFIDCKVAIRNQEPSIISVSPFGSHGVNYVSQSNLEEIEEHGTVFIYDKSLITSSNFTNVQLKGHRYSPLEDGGYFLNMVGTDFESSYSNEETLVHVEGGAISFMNCDFSNFREYGVLLESQTSFSQIQNCKFNAAEFYADAIAISHSAATELLVKNSTFDKNETAIRQQYGKLRLKCNSFNHSFEECIVAGYNSELEMTTNAGYNNFTDMISHNIKLSNAKSLHVNNGFNYFTDQSSYPIFSGTLQIDGPWTTMMLAQRNRWNASNSIPSSSEFNLSSSITGASIGVMPSTPQSANCGSQDPDKPFVDISGGGSNYMPTINLTENASSMELDQAVQFGMSRSKLWDEENGNDLKAISIFHDVLTHSYSRDELSDPVVIEYLNYAYNWMKHTVFNAITDQTTLLQENKEKFSNSIQQYVNVLNEISTNGIVLNSDYHERFSLELDKAHLLRSIGATESGLNILQNVSLCELDSNERVAINHWLFVFEEEVARQELNDQKLYGVDTVLTDISFYQQPVKKQLPDTVSFGSIVNSPTDIQYLSCNGSRTPENVASEDKYIFNLYPNPSNGRINIEYLVDEEDQGEFTIYSIEGKEIVSFGLKEGRQNKQIDISNVHSGIYIYQFKINGNVVGVGKVTIQ